MPLSHTSVNFFYCNFLLAHIVYWPSLQSYYQLFSITGMEAVGVVTVVGPGLTGREVGDLVAYAGNPMGAYAEEQIVPAEKVVPVPVSIDPVLAASIMLKGMTAQFLVRQCFKVGFVLPHTKVFMFYLGIGAREGI